MDKGTQQLADSQALDAPQATAGIVQSAGSTKQQSVFAEGFRNHTKGEALFNKISYFGFGYVVTTGVSILMTWLLNDKYGKSFDKFKETANEKIGISDSAMEIGTLFLGGTIASVLPVKWLEDSKSKLVKKFDHFYYSEKQIETDPTIQQAYKTLDAEPKQTWLSVFSSRVIAFIATYTVFGLMGSNKGPLGHNTGHSIDKYSMKFGRWFDKQLAQFGGKTSEIVAHVDEAIAANEKAIVETAHLPNSSNDKIAGMQVLRNKEFGQNDRIRSRIWNYIAKDAFYTAITSSILFAFTRILAPIFGKNGESNVQPIAPVTAMNEKSQTPLVPANQPGTPAQAPTTHVSQTTHQARVAAPAMQEITA